jgi:hypothetical protein
MHRIRTMALLVVAPLLLAPLLLGSNAAGSNYAPGSLDRYFRLEWQVVPGSSGPMVEGYVYNLAGQPAERMSLEIDLLDASGSLVGKTSTRVLGGAPAGSRAWFQAKVPAAASYRVEVQSFDWIRIGGGM